MAVYEQKKRDGRSCWMIDFTWEDASGKTKRVRKAAKDLRGRPAKSRTAAEQHEFRLRTQLAIQGPVDDKPPEPASPSVAAYLPDYLVDARVRLKPQTVHYIARTFRVSILPVLGETPLGEVHAEALSNLVRALHERGLSAKTVNNTLSALRAMLSHAHERGRIGAVPTVRWQKVAPSKFDFFTFTEAEKLLAYAPAWATVTLRTGMRIGEVVALKWSDVSLERRTLTVARAVWWDDVGNKHEGPPKNNRERTIPLTPDALGALEGLPHRRGYVFLSEDGQQLRPSQCKWPLWRAQDAAGLRRTGPHALRHTFASHLVMRGVSLPAVQALMGHTTITMTMKYSHLAPDHLRSAIDALVPVH